MTKMILFGILNLAHWNLFVVWCLGFGAYLNDKLKVKSS
jgi:hypothetical protein